MSRSINHWPDNKCAKAFWRQQELPPYKQLLADTVDYFDPKPGERWLDLGCGGGKLSAALWTKSGGTLSEVIGSDVAAVNAQSYARHREQLTPRPTESQFRFVQGNFSDGLKQWADRSFDGVISGLALQYAEDFDQATGRWTDRGYDRVLAEIHRVLKPSGRFVFSVNVPNPAWHRIAKASLMGFWGNPKPHRYLVNAWRMYRYGAWMKREARIGRFHYLPQAELEKKLTAAGFGPIECRLSYLDQAFIFRTSRLAKSAAA